MLAAVQSHLCQRPSSAPPVGRAREVAPRALVIPARIFAMRVRLMIESPPPVSQPRVLPRTNCRARDPAARADFAAVHAGGSGRPSSMSWVRPIFRWTLRRLVSPRISGSRPPRHALLGLTERPARARRARSPCLAGAHEPRPQVSEIKSSIVDVRSSPSWAPIRVRDAVLKVRGLREASHVQRGQGHTPARRGVILPALTT